MCGFVALVNCLHSLEEKKNIFNHLKKTNLHRGPDNIQEYHRDNISILFKRLKILDLTEKSNQPFFNNNKKTFLIFNGEIYNYLELKAQLKKKNIIFKTSSDTEVLMKLYEYYGVNFVKKLRGMFSIIIFDKITDKTYFFRDPTGQKPLHYTKHHGGIIFSSEIKDIISLKGNRPLDEDNDSVRKFLVRGWRDIGEKTFYKDISQVPPGCYGEIQHSKLKIKKYWSLDISGKNKFNPEEFSNKFEKNIRLHLRSHVPIAFCLSGGLDSSSIVQNSLELNLTNHKAYSLLSNYEDDEREEISKFVKQNKLTHEFVNVDNKISNNILEDVNFALDGPTNYPSHLYQYILRKKMKKDGFKVLLIGEGGDEVLGGYQRFFIPYLYQLFHKKNKTIPKKYLENINKYGLPTKDLIKKFKKFERIHLAKNDIENKKPFKLLNFKENTLPDDIKFSVDVNPNDKNLFKKYLLEYIFKNDFHGILQQEDRLSMANSIETRIPFADHKFMEYVFSINEKYFMKDGIGKYMLRTSFNKKYPNQFPKFKVKVPKPGKSNIIVFDHYYEKFTDLLSSSNMKTVHFDSKSVLKKFVREKKDVKMRSNGLIFFRILSYMIWVKNNKKISKIQN